MTYISSLSVSTPLRTSILQAQSDLTTAQTEVSTGRQADLGLYLGARSGTSLSLKGEVDRLTSFTNSNALVATRLSTASSAVDSILSGARSMAQTLTTATGGATAALSTTAQGALASLVNLLNSSTGSQFVFGGVNSSAQPVADYSASSTAKTAIDSAFQSTFGTSQTSTAAGSITGDQMQSFLDTQFAGVFDASGWSADWSKASDTTIKSNIAPSQTVGTSVSANESAFRQLTQAYTMLTEFSGDNLSDGAKKAVVSTATTLVNSAIAGLTNIGSTIGVAQAAVDDANTNISNQINVLNSSVNDLEGIDTYSLSVKITQMQTQLEASYQLTSRLSSLSLVNYLT